MAILPSRKPGDTSGQSSHEHQRCHFFPAMNQQEADQHLKSQPNRQEGKATSNIHGVGWGGGVPRPHWLAPSSGYSVQAAPVNEECGTEVLPPLLSESI